MEDGREPITGRLRPHQPNKKCDYPSRPRLLDGRMIVGQDRTGCGSWLEMDKGKGVGQEVIPNEYDDCIAAAFSNDVICAG